MTSRLVLLAVLAALPLQAQTLKTGEHAAFGRIVVEWAGTVEYGIERSGETVMLRLPDRARPVAGMRPPRNVVAIQPAPDGTVEIRLRPGAEVRHFRVNNNRAVVVDAMDPGATIAEVPGQVILAAGPPEAPTAAEAPQPLALATPAPPPPVTLVLPPAAAPSGPSGILLLLRTPPTAAAAAFRRGTLGMVVVDAVLDDSATLPGFERLAAPQGTLFARELPPGRALALTRRTEGWAVAEVEARSGPTLTAQREPGTRLHVPVAGAARTLAITDPSTGGTLLVGALRAEAGGVAQTRRLPDATLLPSFLGVVVELRSDRLRLDAAADGFSLRDTPRAN